MTNFRICDAYLGTEQDFVQKKVECGNICPGRNVNLTTVWYEYENIRTMCKVIRPWQQIVSYTECK